LHWSWPWPWSWSRGVDVLQGTRPRGRIDAIPASAWNWKTTSFRHRSLRVRTPGVGRPADHAQNPSSRSEERGLKTARPGIEGRSPSPLDAQRNRPIPRPSNRHFQKNRQGQPARWQESPERAKQKAGGLMTFRLLFENTMPGGSGAILPQVVAVQTVTVVGMFVGGTRNTTCP
jgi:hypothetical protein